MSTCFVIGPIGADGSGERKHADLLLHAVIREVLSGSEFEYTVKRADEDADPGMIGDRVVSDIINAELVVADLTDLNPNVFYELGIRHSTEKPTIHMARAGTLLPFDNIAHRTIFVDLGDWDSIKQARERLASSVRAIRDPKYKVSNPITQANASFHMRQSRNPRDVVLAELQDRISSLESSIRIEDHTSLRDKLASLSDYIRKNMKINAIKIYREITRAGLADSKNFVEAIQAGKLNTAAIIHQRVTGATADETSMFMELL